jgi:hypothetical protein
VSGTGFEQKSTCKDLTPGFFSAADVDLRLSTVAKLCRGLNVEPGEFFLDV